MRRSIIVITHHLGGLLLKISTNSRYALRFLLRLASQGGRMTTQSVARTDGISEKMLERIAAKLRHNGFLKSAKGIGGGYELARAPSEITVSQVLRVMETPYLPYHCVPEYEDCQNLEGCVLFDLWREIDEAICAVADRVTLETLVRQRDNRAAEISARTSVK